MELEPSLGPGEKGGGNVLDEPSKKRWIQPQIMNHVAVNRSVLLRVGRIVRARTEVIQQTKPTAPAKEVMRIGTEISFGIKPGSTSSGG